MWTHATRNDVKGRVSTLDAGYSLTMDIYLVRQHDTILLAKGES